MTDQEYLDRVMAEFLETTRYVGDREDWRDLDEDDDAFDLMTQIVEDDIQESMVTLAMSFREKIDLKNKVTKDGEDWADVARRAWETRRAGGAVEKEPKSKAASVEERAKAIMAKMPTRLAKDMAKVKVHYLEGKSQREISRLAGGSRVDGLMGWTQMNKRPPEVFIVPSKDGNTDVDTLTTLHEMAHVLSRTGGPLFKDFDDFDKAHAEYFKDFERLERKGAVAEGDEESYEFSFEEAFANVMSLQLARRGGVKRIDVDTKTYGQMFPSLLKWSGKLLR